MTKEERLILCKVCNNKRVDFKVGIICSLTNMKPDFEAECPSFSKNDAENQKQERLKNLKQRAGIGKKKALQLFYILMGLSLVITIFSFLTHKSLTTQELVREVVRFTFTIGLCYAIYLGKSWAKVVTIVLFAIALLLLLFGLIALINDSPFALTLLIPITIYSYAVYFLTADKDFAAFFKYQRTIA